MKVSLSHVNEAKLQMGAELFVFCILTILAIVFASERIINSDNAFYFFKIVNFESFCIEQKRYSAAISQLPVLLFIKGGLQLQWLVYIFSVTFIALPFLIYLLLRKVFKNREASLTIALVSITGIAHAFFIPVAETTQGIYYSLIFYSVLCMNPDSFVFRKALLIKEGLLILIIILCYYAHPITLFPLLFFTGYFMIDKGKLKSLPYYFLLLLIISLYLFRAKIEGSASYDGEKLSHLKDFKHNLFSFFRLNSTKFIIKGIPGTYFIPFILLLSLSISYIKRKNYLKLFFVNGYVLFYILIHNLIYFAGGSEFEMEKNLMVANLFILLPFINDQYFSRNWGSFKKFALLFLITAFSVMLILKASDRYVHRNKYYLELNSFLKEKGSKKYYTEKSSLDIETIMFPWTLSIETLLHSSMESPYNSLSLYAFEDLSSLPEYIQENKLFLYVPFWERFSVDLLNVKYFNLPMQSYEEIDINRIVYYE